VEVPVSNKLQTNGTKVKEVTIATFVSIVLGLIVLKWEWLASVVGLDIYVERSTSMITVEYVIGLGVAFMLGYAFPKRPVLCAIWLMLGPTLITHTIHLIIHGVPNLWPVELLFLTILTIPYVGLAYGGAYVRHRMMKRENN
jgi:hypothetical protein